MPPKKQRRRRITVPRRPNKNKQKMVQKVHVNVNSSGGSGGGGSSMPAQIPYPFMDRSGENVILQRLSDSVDKFMKQAQDSRALEPRLIAPTSYNDSAFDEIKSQNELIREARINNPIINPRPDTSNDSITQAVAKSTSATQTDAPKKKIKVVEDMDTQTDSPQTNEAATQTRQFNKPMLRFEPAKTDIDYPDFQDARQQHLQKLRENREQYIDEKTQEYKTLVRQIYKSDGMSSARYDILMNATFKTKTSIDESIKTMKNVLKDLTSQASHRKSDKELL